MRHSPTADASELWAWQNACASDSDIPAVHVSPEEGGTGGGGCGGGGEGGGVGDGGGDGGGICGGNDGGAFR